LKTFLKRFSMWLKKRVIPWALPPLAAGIIRLLGSTLRITLKDDEDLLATLGPEPVLFAFWHNRILMMPYFFRKFCPDRTLTVMISRSRDGDLISDIAFRFGIRAARGSSSKFGSDALRALVETVREGNNGGITPDGPRGPRYQIQPGILALADKTGSPVVPVTAHYDRKWELRSWDRFQIPRPFSKCEVVIGPVLPADCPDLKERLQDKLGT
jgi:lysophospholipid acyltransferase (LPLAT)-like uncharacterized protein